MAFMKRMAEETKANLEASNFDRRMYEQYVNGVWGGDGQASRESVYGTDFSKSEYDNKLLTAVGLPGWSAPVGWNNYSTGEMKGGLIRLHKDIQINTKAFEVLDFEMVSDVDKW